MLHCDSTLATRNPALANSTPSCHNHRMSQSSNLSWRSSEVDCRDMPRSISVRSYCIKHALYCFMLSSYTRLTASSKDQRVVQGFLQPNHPTRCRIYQDSGVSVISERTVAVVADMVFHIYVANTPANHAIPHGRRRQRINLGFTGDKSYALLQHNIHSLRACGPREGPCR